MNQVLHQAWRSIHRCVLWDPLHPPTLQLLVPLSYFNKNSLLYRSFLLRAFQILFSLLFDSFPLILLKRQSFFTQFKFTYDSCLTQYRNSINFYLLACKVKEGEGKLFRHLVDSITFIFEHV